MRNHSGIADLIVKGAIVLVTAAFFIGAYLQFQVTFWLALIAALSVYITLLMLHALMRRSERVDALVSEVSRLEGEVARLHGRGPANAAAAARAPHARSTPAAAPVRQAGAQPALPDGLKLKVPTSSTTAQRTSQSTPPPLGPSTQLVPGAPYVPPGAANAPPESEATPAGSPWPGATDTPEATHDYWSFRPSKPSLPETRKSKRKEPPAAASGEREADLEAVQGMIKRLASEVSLGGEAPKEGGLSNQESLMRASVDALQTTADTMRAATSRAPAATPPPIAPAHTRLSSVAAAVAAGRMDVLLNPIVGLADHQVHHYQVTISPRDELGTILPLPVGDRQLAGTGLLALLDSARINRAARVCRSIAEDGQKQCVFASVNAESLGSDRFLDELASVYRQREAVAGELVLAFTQAEVRNFGGTEWSALTDMRDLGFRFAMEDVTGVDYEFTALRAAGFAFVKIDAASFLEGLPSSGEVMPSGEVCMHLGELGLSVIVGHIDEEAARAAVVERAAPLGQGLLFGPPLAVSSDGAAGTAAA